jgi:hypothetical protein
VLADGDERDAEDGTTGGGTSATETHSRAWLDIDGCVCPAQR